MLPIEIQYPARFGREMSISKPRVFLGGILLVLFIGLLLASPFLLWVYHIEVGGQLLDAAVRWPEPRQSDSLPQLQNTNLEATESAPNTSQAEKALNQLHSAIGWRPEHIHAYRLAASIYMAQEEWLQAVQMLKQAQTWAPNHPLLLWEESLIYEAVWQMGEKAPQNIPERLDTEAKMLEAWTNAGFEASDFIERGNEARRRGDYQEALRWYSRAKLMGRALDSGLAYTHYLAQLNDRDDESGAVGLLQEAISLDAGWMNQDDRFRAWSQWGRILFYKKKYVESEIILQKTVEELFPGGRELQKIRADAYRTLARAQMKLDKQDSALQNLQKSIENNDEYLWAHVNYGQLLYQFDPTRIAEAKGAFETALALDSNNVGLWQNLILFWRRERQLAQMQLLCQSADRQEIRSAIADVCQTRESGELSNDWYFEYLALSKQGDQKAAQEALQRAIELDEGWFTPADRFRAWSRWGRILFELKRYDEAEVTLQKAIEELYPGDLEELKSESLRILALTQIELAKPDAALESLEEAISSNNQNLWALVRYGQLLYELHPAEVAQTRQLFEDALRLQPDDVELSRHLILFLRRQLEIEQVYLLCEVASEQNEAAEIAEVCLATDGTEISGDKYFEYQALSAKGEQEEAAEALQRAIELDKGWFSSQDRFQAWSRWGRILFELKQYDEASVTLQKAIEELYPSGLEELKSESLRILALTQIELGQPEEALQNLQQAVESDNQNLWALVRYGQLLYELDPSEVAQSRQLFEDALRLQPNNVELSRNLILFLRRRLEIEQVRLLCEVASEQNGAAEIAQVCQVTDGTEISGDKYFEYQALWAKGEQEKAAEVLEQAIELDEGWFSSQDRFHAWYQWGRPLFEKKQYQEAKEAFETSLQAVSEEVPTHLVSEAYHLLARSQINLGEQEAALESLQKSIEMNTQNSWVFIRYGQLLYEVTPQQLEESTSLFAQALALDPLNIDLWKSITLFWQRKREIDQVRQVCQTAAAQGVEVELATLCQGTDGSDISGGWYFEYQKLSGEGKQEEAYDALAKAVELDEGWFSDVDRFRAWYQWGKTIHQKREFAESERIFKKTVARYPENVGQKALLSDVYRFMAESQNYQGRSDDALNTIQLSLQWNEKNVWAYIFFGQVLYLNNPSRIEEVNEAFATALSLQENDALPWRSLIVFWRRYDEESRAAELCEQVVEKEFAEQLSDICQ